MNRLPRNRRIWLFTSIVVISTIAISTPLSDSSLDDSVVTTRSSTTQVEVSVLGTVATTRQRLEKPAAPTTRSTAAVTAADSNDWWVEPGRSGEAPATQVEGLLTFRGSPSRSFYGRGPVPERPSIAWRYPPTGELCGETRLSGRVEQWCGTGWTGQPAIFRYGDRLWSVFGALDGAVHFLDALTGEPLLDPFQTGDIIKGSVTIDPDGYPIVYTGSRDNYFRAIAFDGSQPRELWRLHADDAGPHRWNNDWDGSALVIDDYLFVGGENSRIHIVKLNRSYEPAGGVTATPELVFSAPGWDDELIASVGENVSIENSVAIDGNTLYFANSGGLVQGWDISDLQSGTVPSRVFRYWVGDDVDASIVIDDNSHLYVAVEYERDTPRSRELGQLLKLDPWAVDDPLLWGVAERQELDTGIWGTPALHDDVVIFGSQGGSLRAVDAETGVDVWEIELGFHLWQSPVVVDEVLIMGDCQGWLYAFDVSNSRVEPTLLWEFRLDTGCIESTPAVWDGLIVVGTRAGAVYGITEELG